MTFTCLKSTEEIPKQCLEFSSLTKKTTEQDH